MTKVKKKQPYDDSVTFRYYKAAKKKAELRKIDIAEVCRKALDKALK